MYFKQFYMEKNNIVTKNLLNIIVLYYIPFISNIYSKIVLNELIF